MYIYVHVLVHIYFTCKMYMNVQYILYAVHVHVYLYLQFPGEDDALDLVHVSPNMHVQ